MPNNNWGPPPVVKHLRTRIPEWNSIRLKGKSNDRTLILTTFHARVVGELDTLFADPTNPLAIYGELQKTKKGKDGKDEPLTTHQAKIYKVTNWFPNNANKGSDGRKDVLPVMKIKPKSAGIQHSYYMAQFDKLNPLLTAAYDEHKKERAAEKKTPTNSGAFHSRWKSQHWETLDAETRQAFIDSTSKTAVAAADAAKSEVQKEQERMENAHEHQKQVDKVIRTVNTFHTNLGELTGAVTMTFVAYINPKLGGQPDIQVLSHGKTIASGFQYPDYNPTMINAVLNDYRGYVNECFAYEDRVRLSLSPRAIPTQAGTSITTGVNDTIGNFLNPATPFVAPAMPAVDGISMQQPSTNIAATEGNAQAQQWQMSGGLDGMSQNGNVAVQPLVSPWSHSPVDSRLQPFQQDESWMSWNGSGEPLCLDQPLATAASPPPRDVPNPSRNAGTPGRNGCRRSVPVKVRRCRRTGTFTTVLVLAD